MRPFNLAELIILGTIWGSSFLFMRIAVPEFGPFALILVRVAVATVFLLPIAILLKQHRGILTHWRVILFAAIANTALPFTLLSYSTLHLNAGIASVLNAMVPIFTPIVAFFWLRQGLSWMVVIGILSGFIGVYLIAQNGNAAGQTEIKLLPILTGVLASVSYAIAANFTVRYLTKIKPLTIAAGGQLFATIILLPFGLYFWPDSEVSTSSWLSAVMLGVLCTGIAFIIFYHLISQVGSSLAVLVTYITPLCGILLGYLFLNETIGLQSAIGGGFIVLGITLATKIYRKIPL